MHIYKKRKSLFYYLALSLYFVMAYPGTVTVLNAGEAFEAPPTLSASKVLPMDWLKGPYHRVDETVENDGYINIYTIYSRYGKMEAASTALLQKRISEIHAIANMKKVKTTDEFNKAMLEAGEDVVEGTVDLILSPIDTLEGAVSGVGKAFYRVGESLFGSKASDLEDSRLESAIGFSKTKREYAKQFGVDVYSANPILQKHLEEISWAGYAGRMSISAATAVVPTAASVAVSISGTSQILNEVIADSSPTDLRRMNREKLLSMETCI